MTFVLHKMPWNTNNPLHIVKRGSTRPDTCSRRSWGWRVPTSPTATCRPQPHRRRTGRIRIPPRLLATLQHRTFNDTTPVALCWWTMGNQVHRHHLSVNRNWRGTIRITSERVHHRRPHFIGACLRAAHRTTRTTAPSGRTTSTTTATTTENRSEESDVVERTEGRNHSVGKERVLHRFLYHYLPLAVCIGKVLPKKRTLCHWSLSHTQLFPLHFFFFLEAPTRHGGTVCRIPKCL
jgi:hypothetical protein